MDALGENHDQVLDEAKTRIATEMKATADAVLQHTSSGICKKDLRVVLSTCKTYQAIKATKTKSHPGFLKAFDNIDIHLEQREMAVSLNNQDIHSVNHEMVQNRSQKVISISRNLRGTLQTGPVTPCSFSHCHFMSF